jgi:hypothetical protein
MGMPLSSTGESVIEKVVGNTDFLGMKTSQDITMTFDCNEIDLDEPFCTTSFNLNEDSLFSVYLIPELGENKLFIISSYNFVLDEYGRKSNIEVTFTTLSDKLQESGRAIEQYVNWNAGGIGSGYAYPKIIKYMNGEKGYMLDQTRLNNTPVRA